MDSNSRHRAIERRRVRSARKRAGRHSAWCGARPNPPNELRGTFLTKPHPSTASTATVAVRVSQRQRSARDSIHTYALRLRGQRLRRTPAPCPSAGTTINAVNTLQIERHQERRRERHERSARIALQVQERKQHDGRGERANPRPPARCDASPARDRPACRAWCARRFATTIAFCTRMPTPMPSPASVSRLAGMSNR